MPSPFNTCSMTRAAATNEHDTMFRSPSDRIASYLSPAAMNLTKTALKEKIGGSAFSSPIPKSPRKSPSKHSAHGHFDASFQSGHPGLQDGLPATDSMHFSRRRVIPLRDDDEIQPFSEVRAPNRGPWSMGVHERGGGRWQLPA